MIKKSFKLFSIGCKIVFISHISAFFNSVAPLCNEKKLKSETKTQIFRFNQKSLNDFKQKLPKSYWLFGSFFMFVTDVYSSKAFHPRAFNGILVSALVIKCMPSLSRTICPITVKLGLAFILSKSSIGMVNSNS